MKFNSNQEINSKIDYWLERASSFYSEGKNWYTSANEWAKTLGNDYNVHPAKVAGICAALSPRKEWNQNKKITEEFLQCNTCGHFGRQVKRAQVIYEEDVQRLIHHPYKYLGGLKTTAFFQNIYDPNFKARVTIDFRIWKFFKPDDWNHITKNRYFIMQDCFISKALDMNLIPCELQAILWLTTKHSNDFSN